MKIIGYMTLHRLMDDGQKLSSIRNKLNGKIDSIQQEIDDLDISSDSPQYFSYELQINELKNTIDIIEKYQLANDTGNSELGDANHFREKPNLVRAAIENIARIEKIRKHDKEKKVNIKDKMRKFQGQTIEKCENFKNSDYQKEYQEILDRSEEEHKNKENPKDIDTLRDGHTTAGIAAQCKSEGIADTKATHAEEGAIDEYARAQNVEQNKNGANR